MKLPSAHSIKYKLIQSIAQTADQLCLLNLSIDPKVDIDDNFLIGLRQQRAIPYLG